MERVAIDEVEPETFDPENRSHTRRPLTEHLGATGVAINHFVLDPGERFTGAVHAHADQEELFVVLEGTATFQTRDGEVAVGPDEAIRFAPGEFQRGGNDGDEPVVALALGAPRDSEDVRIDRVPGFGDVGCPECGHDHMRIAREENRELVCPECGGELETE